MARDGAPEASSAAVRAFPPTATAGELRAELERNGALIVRRLVKPERMALVAGQLESHLERAHTGDRDSGFLTRRLDGVLSKAPAAVRLVLDPLVLAVVDAVLGPRCINFQLSSTQAVHLLPGERATPFHRDDDLYPFERPGPQHQVGTIWAVTDFTADNGGTRVVPGSHLWGSARRPRDDEAVSIEMTSGSVMIQMGSTWHSGGSNRSAAARTALVFNFVLGWLRQEENQYLAVPRATARGFPERLQRLMGYASHGKMLGYYEGQDPDWT